MNGSSGYDPSVYPGGTWIQMTPSNALNVCYYGTVNTNLSVWKISNPLFETVPVFAAQLCIAMFMIRLFFYIFNFIRQPRFFAEIITACLVGPVFTRSAFFIGYIHKWNSHEVLETMANLGLVYYMFLVGLEIDLNMVRRVGKKALCNAVAGILFSMTMGAGLYFLFTHDISIFPSANPLGGLFWGVALTVTSFPDLAQVLSDINLISTDLGQIALSSAFVNDLASWTILIITMTMLTGYNKLSILPTVGFVMLCWFVVRPILSKIKTSLNKSSGRDFQVNIILAGVLICGLITDACGSHSVTGAFVFGIVIQNMELERRFIEQVNDFVIGIMLPAFYLVAGGKIDIAFMMSQTNVVMLLVIIVLACSAKVLSSFLVCKAFGISARDGIALGVLMNTKGLLALIVIGVGRDVQALDNVTYPAIVIVFVVMTAFGKPFPYWASKSSKHLKQYKHRTIETSKEDSEFRVIMCVHESRHLSGLSTLLKLSNSTKLSPISTIVLHLVELTGRSSAMLIVHDTYKSSYLNQPIFERVLSDHIRSHSFGSNTGSRESHPISIQPVTIVSPYAAMHREICSVAQDEHVTIILVPFHKEGGGNEEQENSSIRIVNQNLLAKAPCSVGIFVDRGLHLNIRDKGIDLGKPLINVVMLFTGGPDDREALAYAWRMAGSSDVLLTVLRFQSGEEAKSIMEEAEGSGNDKQIDEKYVNEFRFKSMCNDRVTYLEKVVNNGDDIMRTIKEMFDYCDLYMLGRGQGVESPFTLGLSEWSDCKDLGVLGEALSTSEFARNASILVIQQHYVADS
ncbi:unnamed protein product [Dovyalis caffra]|uniref:Cation/H+ exchanger domain-containing protein n=1 Tax=Dovyalis caffra TaxID=77055 RepID=A0AAV1SMI3_9ROSI|nr:unnamed protein product [Dovyalis caffra]